MSNTIPYIGSKISLISNSEIRYEGILYTINTQESTIALQSVKTFGTEGRKIPEIPPSSEVYDFIIFRGQDIKDLTVLEGAQSGSSPMSQDPAIMSMNQRPAGGGPKGGKADSKGKASHDKGGYGGSSGGGGGGGWGGKGWEQPSKGSSKGMPAWGGAGAYGGSYGGGRSDGWAAESWGKGGGKWDDGKGRGGKDGGYGKGKGKEQAKGGKAYGKGGGKDDGKGYGKGKDSYGKGKKGDSGKGSKGDGKARRGPGAGTGAEASGVPVGELLPEENAATKKEFAAEFEFAAANEKFEKVMETADGAGAKEPLSGYNKTSSFFDNISCEATDRAADVDRVKVDRDKARQYDKETFGDTRRPARPLGARRGKGKGKGGGKGGYRS